MKDNFFNKIKEELSEIKKNNLYKTEKIIYGPQSSNIQIKNKTSNQNMINMCSNNYLGLSNHPEVIEVAKSTLEKNGVGMASVRFICGTQKLHKELENKISEFYNTEDTILYPSCFDANCGLFEVVLSKEDAIISDSLNHASIIDGIRLCKAQKYIYRNNDMSMLEDHLKQASKDNKKIKMIATDGVFSMDGYIANLKEICLLANKYGAITMIDECHSAGFLGKTGRGTPEYCDVIGEIDIITGTLGKALSGTAGGYITGKKIIIDLLRQRSRPYLFSNSLSPCLVAAAIKSLDIITKSTKLRDVLMENTDFYRRKLKENNINIKEGIHPIVPIMIGDSLKAEKIAYSMYKRGVHLVAFYYPVVPKNEARIRTQVSAEHTKEELSLVIEKLIESIKENN